MKVLFKSIFLSLFLSACSGPSSNVEINDTKTEEAQYIDIDSTVLAGIVQATYPLKENSRWQAVYEDLDCSGLPELFSVVVEDSVISMRMTSVDTTVNICSANGKFSGILNIRKYVSEQGGFLFVNTTSKQSVIIRQKDNITESVDLINGVASSSICAINPLVIDRVDRDIVYVDFDCQGASMKDSFMTGCITYKDVPFFVEDGVLRECIGVQQFDISHYYGVEKVMNKIKEDGGVYTHSIKCDVRGKETQLFVNYEIRKPDHVEYYHIKCKTHLHYLIPECGVNEKLIVYPGNRKTSYLEMLRQVSL